MTNPERRHHELNQPNYEDTFDEILRLFSILRGTVSRLPKMPAATLGDDGYIVCHCPICDETDWILVQTGYEYILPMHIEVNKTGNHIDVDWVVTHDGTDSFTDDGNGPDVVECRTCHSYFQRPDNLTYN